MNINSILAVLVLKNVITEEEAERIAEYIHDKPQSTVLADAISDIKPLLVPTAVTNPELGPVGPVQRQEEISARTADILTPPVDEAATTTDSHGHHHLLTPEAATQTTADVET